MDEDRFTVRVSAESNFAWLRTRLALERTLMAWVRTASALIGFGFTIVEFFNRLHAMSGAAPAEAPAVPRYLGLALIASGVAATAVSVWQYRRSLRYLWSSPFRPIAGVSERGMHTPLLAITIAIAFIGLFAFFAVLLRVP